MRSGPIVSGPDARARRDCPSTGHARISCGEPNHRPRVFTFKDLTDARPARTGAARRLRQARAWRTVLLQEIEFQAEDRSAAKAIVSLMLGVFTLGLLGSITICLVIGA